MKKHRLLITAGPVWVPLDRVRALTNRFTGKTGFSIALEAARQGYGVTLLLGPGRVEIPASLPDNFEIIRFETYDDLYGMMEKHLSSHLFDAVFHSSAVPDYVPVNVFDGKIQSGQDELTITLKPTKKIVDQIRLWDKNILLVKFKLEVGLSHDELINKARESMRQSDADLICANDLDEMAGNGHKAYIIDRDGNVSVCDGNNDIAKKLLQAVKCRLSCKK
ncbi:MAG: phosphopantothenoylcysteine decarboxylase [Candidatus Pacebacteria bacterium]|jgi:phosphopantothenoylcysteine synthetase/decarboxylase|nr:phosphopantothenoylcysteine decarboxylase [Candidatus Paceibacterota bacterium]